MDIKLNGMLLKKIRQKIKIVIYFITLFNFISCQSQKKHITLGSTYNNIVNFSDVIYNDYSGLGITQIKSKSISSFLNTKCKYFIQWNEENISNTHNISFTELILIDSKNDIKYGKEKIRYLFIEKEKGKNKELIDTLKIPKGFDYSQFNYKSGNINKTGIAIGKYNNSTKKESFELCELYGLNDMGKLSKLPLSTVIYDCPPPTYYLREYEPEEYSYEIKQKYNKSTIIPKKWYGVYHVINKESKDWREEQSISLSISKDSIIYEIAGYQMYEKYLLKGEEINSNILSLTYLKYLDGIESAVLEKTKDFGKIYFDGKKYLWKCPYLDFYYHKKRYRLKKE
ncbi:hypothetical protein [Apibacter sp. B2966]|uniref:hypothetical protein n=1 Tax=Apibacter sp. B2966 TaxID=2656761 RepID=UPI00140D905B|nr:hypothetical protein [Apibacter sp. B2966]QII72245.1 hypothetical protein G8C43_05480 [Apibacter sp. B2966]